MQLELAKFQIVWPDETACEKALADFAKHRLASNLGLLDSLIAHTAIGRSVPLGSFNVKHFSVVTGLALVQPY